MQNATRVAIVIDESDGEEDSTSEKRTFVAVPLVRFDVANGEEDSRTRHEASATASGGVALDDFDAGGFDDLPGSSNDLPRSASSTTAAAAPPPAPAPAPAPSPTSAADEAYTAAAAKRKADRQARLADAAEWVTQRTGQPFPGLTSSASGDADYGPFIAWLRDGTVLCAVANTLRPGLVPTQKASDKPNKPFAQVRRASRCVFDPRLPSVRCATVSVGAAAVTARDDVCVSPAREHRTVPARDPRARHRGAQLLRGSRDSVPHMVRRLNR